MVSDQDFERAWQAKFSNRLDEVAGEGIRQEVMEGCEDLSSRSSPQEVIAWTRLAMDRLDSLVGEDERKEIMTGCSCQYPKSDLQAIRHRYEETGDLDLVHRLLQEQFESFLKDTLQVSDEDFEVIVERGWGLAGVKKGDTIIATKIPKSGNLFAYMNETDPEKRRQYYCHCPRVREAVKTPETISPTYCCCGAGFYKGVWEEILQESVEVEVLESVLQGDDVCKVAILMPSS